jgi:multiple sugar transport system substrate-binding protein
MKPVHKMTFFVLTVLLFALVPAVMGQSDFDWRQFEGTQLRGIMIQGPWIDSARPHLEAFEELTGITVDLEVLPEAEAWDKIRIEMQAGNPNLDLFYNQTSRFGLEFVANGWVEPLDDYIANAALTNPDFNWDTDFVDYVRNGVTFDGQIIGIPTDRQLGPMMFYRRDILDEYDVAVPQTLEELAEAAKYIWEASGNTIPGIVYRGQGASATSHFSYVLHEFGAVWEDEEGNPTLTSDEMLAAFRWYGDTLREAGSIGATAFAFPETVNEFLTGNAAFTIELGINPGNVSNPDVSNVAGLVGYTVIPSGPGGDAARYPDSCAPFRPFAISISSFSTKKDAAWLFIQYMTGFEPQLSYLKAGRVAARISPWESQEFEESLDEDAREYWAAQSISSGFCYKTQGFAPPSIRDIGRARDIIGQVIETAILGGDVDAAAMMAQEELQMIRDRERN